MDWLTNEVIFYSGIIVVGLSVLSGGLYLGISKIRALKLKNQLDLEYGKPQSKKI